MLEDGNKFAAWWKACCGLK